MLRELVNIVTMQLRSRCKEIVKSSLDFIKVSNNWILYNLVVMHTYRIVGFSRYVNPANFTDVDHS